MILLSVKKLCCSTNSNKTVYTSVNWPLNWDKKQSFLPPRKVSLLSHPDSAIASTVAGE
jgi:hypothetical protein